MMAEAASSIITIVLLGIAVVKGCRNYIDAIREVDDLVEQLLSKVTELHKVVRFLNAQYQQAELSGATEPLLLVHEKITQCRNRLRHIKPQISELEACSTETFVDKTSLKRKMDTVAKDIDSAIDDIRRHLTDIALVTGACSYLEFTSYIRRVSENLTVPPMIQDSSKDILQLVQSRTDSITTSCSRPSVCTEDWRAFHYAVSQCRDDSARIEEIRSTLEQHAEPSALVNILGDHQRAPLHLAAMRGYIKLASILLDFGGDINAKDAEPASALDHAVENKKDDFVRLLLAKGVDETAILERNKFQLKEIKSAISLRKTPKQSSTRDKPRKLGWGIGRKRSG